MCLKALTTNLVRKNDSNTTAYLSKKFIALFLIFKFSKKVLNKKKSYINATLNQNIKMYFLLLKCSSETVIEFINTSSSINKLLNTCKERV